jgi:hypothetical protein
MTDYGGHQQKQLDAALRFPKGGRFGIALGVAVLDGVVWIRSKRKMHRQITELKGVALSALLLEDFLRSLT